MVFDYGPDPDSYAGDTYHPLRYFSVSIYRTYLFALSDTLKDAELKVDPDGYITVVILSRDKKPGRDPVLGGQFNWLEWGSPYPSVVLREMYAHPGYGQAWNKILKITILLFLPGNQRQNCKIYFFL